MADTDMDTGLSERAQAAAFAGLGVGHVMQQYGNECVAAERKRCRAICKQLYLEASKQTAIESPEMRMAMNISKLIHDGPLAPTRRA